MSNKWSEPQPPITTTQRYHDWGPGTRVGKRLVQPCRGCGATRVYVVKADGKLLPLSVPQDGKCGVRTNWAKARMIRQSGD